MKKCEHWQAFRDREVKLFLGKTQLRLRVNRTVPAAYHQQVVVATANHLLDQGPGIIIRGRKKLHACWHCLKL
jgi:hypothetical protein